MDNLKEAITCLSGLIEKILQETLDKADFSDLTQQQLQNLKVIVKMKNPTLSGLADELGLTKPTVSVLVDKLVAKGYIRRVRSVEDKRSMHLHTDKKGEKINMLRDIAYERLTEKIRSGLSVNETTVFTELLAKIVM